MGKQGKKVQHQPAQTTDKLTKKPSVAGLFGRYEYERLTHLLHDIEVGIALEDACYPDIDYDEALVLYKRALSLAQDKMESPIASSSAKNAKPNPPTRSLAPRLYIIIKIST